MRTANLVTAGALALLGGIVVFDALRLGVGWGTDGPKSGFFPFWLAVIMVVTSVLIMIQTVARSSRRPFVTGDQLRPVLTVLGPATALVVGIQLVGLYVASALYMAAYMRGVGRHRWGTIAGLSIAIPVITFVVFERWFLVPMPKGPLETWLGF